MFGFLTEVSWSPYIAGAGIGVLSCLALVVADRPLGCSTAFVKARGLIGSVFYFSSSYRSWIYIVISVIFISFHLSHALTVYLRNLR